MNGRGIKVMKGRRRGKWPRTMKGNQEERERERKRGKKRNEMRQIKVEGREERSEKDEKENK